MNIPFFCPLASSNKPQNSTLVLKYNCNIWNIRLFCLTSSCVVLQAEQQLVDCAGAFDNHGCNGWVSLNDSLIHLCLFYGFRSKVLTVKWSKQHLRHMLFSGLPSHAFEYIMYNKGLMTEQDYPYKAIVSILPF